MNTKIGATSIAAFGVLSIFEAHTLRDTVLEQIFNTIKQCWTWGHVTQLSSYRKGDGSVANSFLKFQRNCVSVIHPFAGRDHSV